MTVTLLTSLPAGPGPGGGLPLARARARAAHEGGIDALILPDRPSTGPDGPDGFEAGTLAAALTVATEGIGLVPTISTEYAAPYHVARLLATIDQFGGGRAGWAIAPTATAADAANHHAEAPAPLHAQRARADEFARVTAGLWDSFQDDAFLRDRDSGVYFVPERLRGLDHRGEYFAVAGPLNIARPPQGHPVLVRRVSAPEDAASAALLGDLAVVPLEVSDAAADLARALDDACAAAGRRRQDMRLLLERRAGTPADDLLREAEAGPADGFVLVPADGAEFETALETARTVRQKFPQGTGATLRARLGLPRPAGR